MFFLRIDVTTKYAKIETDSKSKQGITFNKVLSEKSESLFQKLKRSSYIFTVSSKENKLTLCAILKNICDIHTAINKYESMSEFNFVSIKYEEITFNTMKSLLRTAEINDFINDSSEILRCFGLQELGTYKTMHYTEFFVNENNTKDNLFSKASQLIYSYSLESEIERIYYGKPLKKVKGHPVHYIIQCNNHETINSISQILLSALYINCRIQNRRYAFIDLDSKDERFNFESYKAIYKSCEGGAVTIKYKLSDYNNLSNYANPDVNIIEKVCEVALEYRHSVLTLIFIEDDYHKLRDLFLENLDTISIIELKESIMFEDKAKVYLKNLAKSANITPNKKLFHNINNTNKGFNSTDLRDIFNNWYDNKLKTSIYPQYREVAIKQSEIINSKPKGYAYSKLNSMIGLSEAKATINKALNFYKMQKIYKSNGIIMKSPSMHMIFSGNPGTAKTTVARLFAKIMKDNGLLSKGDLYEVSRSDLVGKYVGWTAKLVKEKFKDAIGSVLFIDEAYSLVDNKEGMYGDEAINTIVQEMENNRDNIIVIFAGYPDKMEQFISRNPGLRSRIAFYVPFNDYCANELIDIAQLIASEKSLHISKDAIPKIHSIFDSISKIPDFGNGRFVRNLMENAIMEQSSRILSSDINQLNRKEICCLNKQDFVIPVMYNNTKKLKIGF